MWRNMLVIDELVHLNAPHLHHVKITLSQPILAFAFFSQKFLILKSYPVKNKTNYVLHTVLYWFTYQLS